MCDDGFEPNEHNNMVTVCSSTGKWISDPAEFECTRQGGSTTNSCTPFNI